MTPNAPSPVMRVAPYATEGDIAAFFAECVTLDPAGRVELATLHSRHLAWCHDAGCTPIPARRLSQYILAPRQRSSGYVYILGIRLT